MKILLTGHRGFIGQHMLAALMKAGHEITIVDGSLVCVVEDIRDVIAIENTAQFRGHSHVLGGIISPLDGVGPNDLNIESLISRVTNDEIEELIFALNPNIQGDTTIYYIQKKMQGNNCKVTTIARGIAFGGELEFADEMTLAKSLTNRLPVQQYVK